MTYLRTLLAAGSLACLAFCYRADQKERERRARARRWVERFQSEMETAVPRDDDPEAPAMSEERCAQLGHAAITRHSPGRIMKSCARCGWCERVSYRDFDARR